MKNPRDDEDADGYDRGDHGDAIMLIGLSFAAAVLFLALFVVHAFSWLSGQ